MEKMRYQKDWEKRTGIEIILQDHFPKEFLVGRKYHVAWAKKRGMVWRLKEIQGDMALLITPKSRKEIRVKKSDLRELNDMVFENAKQRAKVNVTNPLNS